jgi:hypothetical protein
MMKNRMLEPFGRLTELDAKCVLEGQLVLAALPPPFLTVAVLRRYGAKDVLVLEPGRDKAPCRTENAVHSAYTRLSDVRRSNCRVAILHGSATLAVLDKAKVRTFQYVLIPIGPSILSVAGALLRYARRGHLSVAGRTQFGDAESGRRYLVLRCGFPRPDNRRQYAPTGLSPAEILRSIADLEQVVLRWSDKIADGTHEGDIDILVKADAIPAILERFSRSVGTYPIDVYTDDGSGGFAYKSVPYLVPSFALRVIASGAINRAGFRIANPQANFMAFCYHLTFHNKSERIAPDTNAIERDTFHSPHYFEELGRLANLAGRPVPRSYDDIEAVLKAGGAMPSLDLIGFYSRGNAFLRKRYFKRQKARPGLATFYVRNFGDGNAMIDDVRSRLTQHFLILAEGPVTIAMRSAVIAGVRGGNWQDPRAPDGRAEPIHWFVCYDPHPKPPSASVRRKHPHLDNEHIRLKDAIREDWSGQSAKALPVVHSSDNSLEALDHISHLGLSDHPSIRERIAELC